MKRAVWAAVVTLLATGAARADLVGNGTPLCGTVGWGGWTFYTPCPQLPSPDPIYSPPDNGGNTPSIPGLGTLPPPAFPGSDGSPDNFNTNTGDGNTNTGGLDPAVSGGGDPSNTGSGDPPNTGSGDPPNTGSGDPPNTGSGDPPITNSVLTTDAPNGGDISAVPEPSTMSLVLASLAGLGLTRLRKAYRR